MDIFFCNVISTIVIGFLTKLHHTGKKTSISLSYKFRFYKVQTKLRNHSLVLVSYTRLIPSRKTLA